MPRAPIRTAGVTIKFGTGWKFGTRKKFGQPWRILSQKRRVLL